MQLLVGDNLQSMDPETVLEGAEQGEHLTKAEGARVEDDGKPGESLAETKTSELQSTYNQLQARYKKDPQDEGVKKRLKAIGDELKKREGMQKALPSEEAEVSPEKAKQILRDNEVHGKTLTEAQRGMFGAIAGKAPKKKETKKSLAGIEALSEYLQKAEVGVRGGKIIGRTAAGKPIYESEAEAHGFKRERAKVARPKPKPLEGESGKERRKAELEAMRAKTKAMREKLAATRARVAAKKKELAEVRAKTPSGMRAKAKELRAKIAQTKKETKDIEEGSMRKGMLVGGYGMSWADRLVGTPFEKDALMCLKRRNDIDKAYDELYRKYDYSEMRKLDPVARAKKEMQRTKERKKLQEKEDAEREKQRKIEEQYLDWRIKQAEKMGKSRDEVHAELAGEGFEEEALAKALTEDTMSGLDTLQEYLAKADPTAVGPKADDSGMPAKYYEGYSGDVAGSGPLGPTPMDAHKDGVGGGKGGKTGDKGGGPSPGAAASGMPANYYSTSYPDMPKGSAGLGNMPMDGQTMPTGETNFGAAAAEDGGPLAGVGTTSGSKDSAPGPGQDQRGQVTGSSTGTQVLSEDDRVAAYMAKEGAQYRKSMTPAGQREQVAHEHAVKEQELRKGAADVAVSRGSPYAENAYGDIEARTEALLKSDFYVGQSPAAGRPRAIIDREILCKSEGCGARYAAMLTACPGCGAGHTTSRVLPNAGSTLGGGGIILEKSNPVLRRPPRVPDVKIG